MENLRDEVIETKRLILRFVQLSDIEDIFEYAQDEDTGPRAGWQPHKNINETKEIVQKWVNAKPNGEIIFAVVKKENNKVIGTMGVVLEDNKNPNDVEKLKKSLGVKTNLYEIGNVIAKPEWGKGYSTEALKAMLKTLFEKNYAKGVITGHYLLNVASAKVQQKANMKVLYATNKQTPWADTNRTEFIWRGITKQEWEKSNN